MKTNRSWYLAGAAVAVLGACVGARESEPVGETRSAVAATRAAEAAPVLPQRFERTFSWGTGAEELRRTPKVAESVVHGPNAVAVSADGRPVVLDRLGGRVVTFDAVSALRTLATVSVDSEDIAAGGDGTWLAFSPVRARAALFDVQGQPVGELAVLRELRDLVGFELGLSRRVRVRTALQETVELGSPSAPLPLPVVQRTKREGAHQLPDGRGVAVRAVASGVALVVVSQPADEATRSEVDKELGLPGALTSARIVGGRGSVVCLKGESVESTPALAVKRRVLCVDVASGSVLFDEALPAPGLYVPRTEVAFGAGRLTFIHPTEKGLTITSVRVLGEEVAP
jgi:hypothetical protein